MQTLLPLGAHGAAARGGCRSCSPSTCAAFARAHRRACSTALEVGGLLLVVVAGLWLAFGASPAPAPAAPPAPVPGLGAWHGDGVQLLTFGGWNEAAYISAELKDARRNMLRALLWSIGLVTALYLLVTWACWRGLGMARMAASHAVAADLLHAAFGLAAPRSSPCWSRWPRSRRSTPR